jgi:hypothetical protein
MTDHRSRALRPWVLLALFGVILVLAAFQPAPDAPTPTSYHRPGDLAQYKSGDPLPLSGNDWFPGSGLCYNCHGPDVNEVANVDANGADVNVLDDWRSSMMANSARDPFWRAKVSHEALAHPNTQAVLEDACTSCHAPQGHYNARLNGEGPYSLASMEVDPVALDGVGCLACHRQSTDSLGLLGSGELRFDPAPVAYGPYEKPIGAPMTSFVGVTPVYSPHMNDAGLCAGCHTLVTETVDLSGNYTGDHFVEQATYQEWVNSIYNTDADPEGGVSCQACHMPRTDDAVIISGLPSGLQPRTPFGLHQLAGANSFMLKLLRSNIASLELTASEEHFDSTIAHTLRNLQERSLLLEVNVVNRDADTAFVDVRLDNIVGHKFPSGYPSRRAFVELVVRDQDGDTLFKSGTWGSNYEVRGHDPEWEPHYDVVRSEDQCQIYEMVLADVNGNKTTVLQRAATSLKDNRLAPVGFTSGHFTYDSVQVVGAETDPDFNVIDGQEGAGSDIVHYHVPVEGYTGTLQIAARVWYQTAPPRWMEEMFALNSAEIDSFRTMYNQADKDPVLVAEKTLVDFSSGFDGLEDLGVRLFPNPSSGGAIQLLGRLDRVLKVSVYDAQGALVVQAVPYGRSELRLRVPSAGTYLVVLHTSQEPVVARAVVL